MTEITREGVDLPAYDAGLLNDFGGGNVEWWWDYIRAELERAHEHYVSHWPASAPPPSPAAEVETLREALVVARNALVRLHEIGPLKSVKREQMVAIATCDAALSGAPAPEDGSGWIKWSGGECPVEPETEVEIELRRGPVATVIARNVDWRHIPEESLGDVVRYRVLRSPRP